MESRNFFKIFSISDHLKRDEILKCTSKQEKSKFCKNFVNELISKSVPVNSNVQRNFIDHCHVNVANVIDYNAKLDSIRTATNWLKNRNVTFEAIHQSAELSWAYVILIHKNTTDDEFQVAGELLRMTILLIDIKAPLNYYFIQGMLDLVLLFAEPQSLPKSKVLCHIFIAMGEKLFQDLDKNRQYCEKVLYILCVCAESKVLCEIMLPFWKKMPGLLKTNRLYVTYIEEFIAKLAHHCRLIDVEMETNMNGASLMTFRENVSELLPDLATIINILDLSKFFHKMMNNSSVIDLEVSLFVIASIAKKIDRCEDNVVPEIVEQVLKLNINAQPDILLISLKLLGQLNHWIAAHQQMYLVRILDFLWPMMKLKTAASSTAVQSLGLICETCGVKMEPYLDRFLDIFKDLRSLLFFPRSETAFIRGLTIAICSLNDPKRKELLEYFINIQFQRISDSQGNRLELLKTIDQLAEIYQSINIPKNSTSSTIFIQQWPLIAQMLDFYRTDSGLMKKITECVECAIRSFSLSALPVLDQVVKHLLFLYASENYNFTLRVIDVIADKFGNEENCKEGLLIVFTSVTMLTFAALDGERKLNSQTIDEYFRLATTFIRRMAAEVLKSPIIIPIIELSAWLCKLDNKAANASILKFLYSIFGNNQNHPDIKLCVEQAMARFGELLVPILISSSVFVFDAALAGYVADIFQAMKSRSEDGFMEILVKALQLIRRKNDEGKNTLNDASISDFVELMKRTKLTRIEMTNGIMNFRKLARGQ